MVLASASPARRRLLTSAGVAFEVRVSGVDEDAITAAMTPAPPADLACALAEAKAGHVAADLVGEPGQPVGSAAASHLLVLGCDSVLEMPDVPGLAGRALGKPPSPREAIARWRLMRGRSGLLHTGHSLVSQPPGRHGVAATRCATTTVRFASDLSDGDIASYVASGEPLGVAGAFTLEGRAMAYIDGIDGDHSNVIGLSMPLLRRMLADVGVPWAKVLAPSP